MDDSRHQVSWWSHEQSHDITIKYIFESHSYPMKPPYPGWGPQSIANPVEVFLWLNSMVCGYNEVDNYRYSWGLWVYKPTELRKKKSRPWTRLRASVRPLPLTAARTCGRCLRWSTGGFFAFFFSQFAFGKGERCFFFNPVFFSDFFLTISEWL